GRRDVLGWLTLRQVICGPAGVSGWYGGGVARRRCAWCHVGRQYGTRAAGGSMRGRFSRSIVLLVPYWFAWFFLPSGPDVHRTRQRGRVKAEVTGGDSTPPRRTFTGQRSLHALERMRASGPFAHKDRGAGSVWTRTERRS